MARFHIAQEMDNEPAYITDDATDPDSEDHEVITISPGYGTPQSRHRLAVRIVEILHQMANSGDEINS